MKKVIDLVKFQLHIYVKGSGFVMPFVLSAIILYMMYSIKPLDIVSSFLISGTIVFLLMVWIGLSVSSGEDVVTEQLLMLRIQSAGSYYASKVLFLICIVLCVDVLYTAFPVVQNFLNHRNLFTREMIVSDVGNAFLLQGGCGFAGAALGSLMHPRIMRDRKMAIILTVFLTILTVVQDAAAGYLPVLKRISWILPQIMLPAEIYGNAKYFVWSQTMVIFIILLFHGMVLSVLKSILCHKNKFR